MTDIKLVSKKVNELLNRYGFKGIALIVENEEEAYVIAPSDKIKMAKDLINISYENLDKAEKLEEECDCPSCSKPKEDNKFFELMQESFPGLLATMPDDVKERFSDKFKDKSDKILEREFERTFTVLQMMNKLLN